jgi:hypothetical protein
MGEALGDRISRVYITDSIPYPGLLIKINPFSAGDIPAGLPGLKSALRNSGY